MRAARLIRLVLLLQTRRSMTAAELAAELEVSERTVSRDVLALSEAGVPVYADRGRSGGYRLIGGYRTRLTGLARTEAEALFLSGVPSALREMGLADAASAARLKVSAALVPELADAQRSAAQRFHLDAPGWWQEPETPPLLPAVADAVWDDRRIAVRYRRKRREGGGDGGGGDGGDGGRAGSQEAEVARELEPYGLVLKAGVWYVAARVGGDFRVYRVDRFTTVDGTAGGGRFTRDETFDLPGFWAERAAAFARSLLREEVVLLLSEQGERRLRYVTDRAAADEAVARGERAACGRLTVRLPVEGMDVAFGQLFQLGPECEVLEPGALRARFLAVATATAALYGGTAGAGTPGGGTPGAGAYGSGTSAGDGPPTS
ncbi:WYL domain-containing protein [Streptomyces sp. Z26]|uniref:helix-turn-helix transcriptional regulator n=1 Tax=Streptomyces sp. Z26 TaxID=2500177 RepID=UPI000EF14308|nr:WYL domain-containing protein [Streptomyces sp. Z26]RLL66471.1 WYL domain-containing protein [Streptomyces sp. Z26]